MSDRYSYCQSDYLLPNILLEVWQWQYKRLCKIKKKKPPTKAMRLHTGNML